MTNAVGYYYNEREERINNQHDEYKNNKNRGFTSKMIVSKDINRDFPFNQPSSDECLNTIASRIVHQLFVENLFVSSLTFHGGTTVISYPWGSYNHAKKIGRTYQSKEAPDYMAFERIGEIMISEAGSKIKKGNQYIDDFELGDMTTVVYPVNGGLEDWAYGAGWDEGSDATVHECTP
mmetsp:Transcript_11442/g.11452  ORF Transcript_11442/g.11452 Transcript_11442/m.11452 type:complete len:178 (+) Transcript_11442:457-990(+)